MIKNDKRSMQDFVDMIEAKDLYTRGHSHHVSVVVGAIYDCLPMRLSAGIDRDALTSAALLHDIGKIKTPDYVLNKDGALSPEEWEIMRRHPEDGKRIIEDTRFAPLSNWILYHHERPDGCGYHSLKESEIPIEASIIAIADTFSALRTYRIYRPALEINMAVRIMRECSGTQLSSELLGCFLSIDINALAALECNCEICRQRRLEQAAALAAGLDVYASTSRTS